MSGDPQPSLAIRALRTLLITVSLAAIGIAGIWAWAQVSGTALPFDDPCERSGGATVCARKQCALGDMPACTMLGVSYDKGHPVKPNARLAAFFYERSCATDEKRACVGLGGLLLEGRGVIRDEKRGEQLLREGCEAKQPEGCYRLAMLESDRNATPEVVLPHFEQACKGNIAKACYRQAQLLVASGTAEAEIIDGLYKRACDQNIGPACFQIATRALVDGSDAFDGDTVAGLLDTACQRRVLEACEFKAYFDEHNDGLPAPAPMLVEALRARCKEGNVAACSEAARILETGDGVPVDVRGAILLHVAHCAIMNVHDRCEHAARLLVTTPEGIDSAALITQRATFEDPCKQGSKAPCRMAGLIRNLEQMPVPDLGLLCEAGDTTACAITALQPQAPGSPATGEAPAEPPVGESPRDPSVEP